MHFNCANLCNQSLLSGRSVAKKELNHSPRRTLRGKGAQSFWLNSKEEKMEKSILSVLICLISMARNLKQSDFPSKKAAAQINVQPL